jgi:Fe-S cluster assembly iron-binding protein IscA
MAKIVDDTVLVQLAELAKAFNRIGIKPVICGGLGVYLCFHKSEDARSKVRPTNDIDLMLTKQQVKEISRREAIAGIITGELEYVVCEDGRHFRFKKAPNQRLDILAQPMEGFPPKGPRVKFVKSKLHGRLTDEARFIDEDLRTINLSIVLKEVRTDDVIEVQVPSPTNLLILKLCAFDDRDQEDDTERAQAHAFDVYITVTLANIEDYREGQRFLTRHIDSQEIQRVASIVKDKFNSVDQPGWQRVLEASNFYPNLSIKQKRDEMERAMRRLIRWFTLSEHNHISKRA